MKSLTQITTADFAKSLYNGLKRTHPHFATIEFVAEIPEIVNTDQGTQCTSAVWTQYLESLGIRISMDGKGRALDNVWIERFWKSIKYDYIFLNPADDGFELYEGVQNHIVYYNDKTHHTTRQSPNNQYLEPLKIAA